VHRVDHLMHGTDKEPAVWMELHVEQTRARHRRPGDGVQRESHACLVRAIPRHSVCDINEGETPMKRWNVLGARLTYHGLSQDEPQDRVAATDVRRRGRIAEICVLVSGLPMVVASLVMASLANSGLRAGDVLATLIFALLYYVPPLLPIEFLMRGVEQRSPIDSTRERSPHSAAMFGLCISLIFALVGGPHRHARGRFEYLFRCRPFHANAYPGDAAAPASLSDPLGRASQCHRARYRCDGAGTPNEGCGTEWTIRSAAPARQG
jgi:hypothetical protein